MEKKVLLKNSFEENNEKKLKAAFIKSANNYSFRENERKLKSIFIKNANGYNLSEKLYFLAIKNQLLLASCDMDENTFNQMLFRNYIYFLNDSYRANLDALYSNNRESFKIFNTCIENNNFEEAFNIFANNNAIYQLLCFIYIKDLYKNEKYKASRVASANINDVAEKFSLLRNADLSVKREKVRILQNVSAK